MATEYFNDAWRIPNNKNQSLVSNYSMEFDGTNDSINVGLIKPFDNDVSNFAISYWVKANFNLSMCHFDFRYNGATRGVALENNSSSIFFYTGGNFSTTWSTPTSGLNNNEWNHIVINFDGSIATDSDKCEYWINGSKKTSTVGSPGNSFSKAITGDGFLGSGFTFKLTGKLDQFCTFDYTLSASQIQTLYGGGTAVTNPMSLSPKPIYYSQLGDQSVDNGANYLVPNNSLQDYVFNFDGNSNQFIAVPLSSDLSLANVDFTISFWINPTATNRSMIMENYYNVNTFSPGWGVFNDNGFLEFLQGSGTFLNTSVSIPNNVWTHLVLVGNKNVSPNTLKVYKNGDLENTFSSSLVTGTTTGPLHIGAERGAFVNKGELSNIAIWSGTALIDTQVTTLYNNGTPNNISSLSPTSWWKLNAQDTFDGTDWTIKDYAGSNDGTSNGMTSANLIQSNLQHTSGFSPYALSLSGGGEYMYTNISALTSISTITTSMWVKLTTSYFGYVLGILGNNSTQISLGYNAGKFFFYTGVTVVYATNTSSAGVWYNIVLTRTGDTQKMYINGALQATATGLTTLSLNDYVTIGRGPLGYNKDADVSNLAIWSSELTTSQITTLYNQGLPSNLSTFSTKPIFWSQFGTNSSFNASANRWTSIDEISGNNVLSHTVMSGDDIVNGAGYSGNGLGTSSIEIVGDAPYSTANGISENMDVLDRTTDVPS